MKHLTLKSLLDTWSNIIKVKVELDNIGIASDRIFPRSVCSREEILFWSDGWLDHEVFLFGFLPFLHWKNANMPLLMIKSQTNALFECRKKALHLRDLGVRSIIVESWLL